MSAKSCRCFAGCLADRAPPSKARSGRAACLLSWTFKITGNANRPVIISWLDAQASYLAWNGPAKALRHGYCLHDDARLFDSRDPEFEDIMAADTIADEPS